MSFSQKSNFFAFVLIYSWLFLFAHILYADTNDPHEQGVVAFLANDYKSAKHFFKKAEKLYPGNPVVIYNLALAYYYTEDYFPSLKKLNTALSIDPGFTEALFTRGVLYLKKKQVDSAAVDFKKGCDLGYKISCNVYDNL